MTEPIPEDQTGTGSEESLLGFENNSCDGCGMSIAYRLLSRAVSAEYKVQLVIPACCGNVASDSLSPSPLGAPVVASPFTPVTSVATGLAQAAAAKDDGTRVIAWAGAGRTHSDDGLVAVSAAAERNDDVLYVCYDNEIIGDPKGEHSSKTPAEGTQKRDVLTAMAAKGVPYVASINLADPADTMRKMKYALDTRGFRFLQVMSPCPTGWESEPSESMELIRLAVDSGLFPVIEIFHGREYVINVEPEMCDKALERYLGSQGRFKRSGVTVETVRAGILENWEDLRTRARAQ